MKGAEAPTAEIDWKQLFGEYHLRHGKQRFTPDFNAVLDAAIADQRLSLTYRVICWVKRNANGNYSDYAVDDPVTRRPLYQTNCATDLKVDRRRISEVFAFWRNHGYVRIHNRRIYSLDRLEAPMSSDILSHGEESVRGDPDKASPKFRLFFQRWAAGNPERHREYQDARRLVSQIKSEILTEYNKSRRKLPPDAASKDSDGPAHPGQKSQKDPEKTFTTAWTESAVNDIKGIEDYGRPSVPTDQLFEFPTADRQSPTDDDIVQSIPIGLCKLLRQVPGPKLISQIRKNIGNVPLSELTAALIRSARRWASFESLGVVANVAADLARIYRRDAETAASTDGKNEFRAATPGCPSCHGTGRVTGPWLDHQNPNCPCISVSETHRLLAQELLDSLYRLYSTGVGDSQNLSGSGAE